MSDPRASLARMGRFARTVVPGIAHHVCQRGNRRLQTYLVPDDFQLYASLVAFHCRKQDVEVLAYCLMPNHSHLVVVPPTPEALRLAIGAAHQAYTAQINEREGWTGHLWQGRFFSCPMDPAHTLRAVRYVELNPVRAGLVVRAEDWAWSSARAHLAGRDDGLVTVAPMLELVPDWASFLGSAANDDLETLRRHTSTGRPLGSDAFVDELERQLQRSLRPAVGGRPRRL